MKFIVDRKTWFRGKGGSESSLLKIDGTMCCIGFVGKQCGASKVSMLNIPDVESCVDASVFPEWMFYASEQEQSQAVMKAYTVNDATDISDTQREVQLKLIFAANGDEIEFVG